MPPCSSAPGPTGPTYPSARPVGQAGLVDKAGNPISPALEDQISQRTFHGTAEGDAYLRALGLHLKVVYQPAGRFWTYQIVEASLFIGLAVALLGTTVRLLHRRST